MLQPEVNIAGTATIRGVTCDVPEIAFFITVWTDIRRSSNCDCVATLLALPKGQGPHDYISPSWYSSPGVPTWNYQAVHIYGVCSVFTDTDKIKKVVDSLTHKYELAVKESYQPEYDASMLGFIVGIEIAIAEIQCKYKLSQNRSNQDQERVAEQLEKRGSYKMAKAIRRNAL